MRKLKLEVEDLAVESFTTRAAEDEQGTVEGHESDFTFCQCTETRYYSQCCTNDPNDLQCYSYAIQCPATHPRNGC